MRNIRKAAVSCLTAAALVAGGTTAATAETNNLGHDIKHSNSSNSSVWGNRYNADAKVTGVDLLGWEKNWSGQPVWAQIWYVATVLGVIGSVVGLVSLPIINDAKAKGFVI